MEPDVQAAVVGNIDSENDFEDDFGGSSVASSTFIDHDIFRGEDDVVAPVSNLDILQRVELQRRSTGFDYDNDQGSKKESEDDASSDGDDSVKSIDDDRDEDIGNSSVRAKDSTQYYGNRFGSNRIQTKGGVPSRPKAKYGSRTMRRDLRRAGGFDSEEDSDEEILGSTIYASGPDHLEAASATNTLTSHANALCAKSSSSHRLMRFGTQGDHQPGDDASLPGTTTKLSRRSSLSEYIDPSRTKRGKTMRTPVDFRRLIVVVAVCAAMTFTIGLSKRGIGHVDKQIAKQIEELERRAKEMQSPSEQLRSAMYANSLQNIPNAEESEEDSIAVDATNMATSTDTSTPRIGGKPQLPQDQAEELSNEHKTIQVQDQKDNLLPETMNNPDLGSPSSKTLPTGSTTTVGTMSLQQDVQHLAHMEHLKKLSPEIMKILTPEQQQQFLIMTFQRMQYQNQLERMKAAISKAPEEVKRLLGIPLEAVRRRMNLRHQNKGNLRKMQNAMPAEIIEISPEENLYYEP